jgi:type II secretory pathway component PulF
MNTGDNQDRDRAIREKIARQMRSIGNGSEKQITTEELQKLRNAAMRLDQMLKATADADQQALRSAAARLNQLLSDIRAGKDVTDILKRKR